jgi:hypothetical protein
MAEGFGNEGEENNGSDDAIDTGTDDMGGGYDE